MQAGGVLFFSGSNDTIQHGDIYIGDEGFIHASSSNGKVVVGYFELLEGTLCFRQAVECLTGATGFDTIK